MFLVFEGSKRYFLYSNGYTESPWDNIPKEDVDQTLKPHELRSVLESLKDQVETTRWWWHNNFPTWFEIL